MDYVHGLDSLLFGDKEIGNISNDSIDWGGDELSTVKIWAAQKRSAPVTEIIDSPGTDVLEFDLIELKPENLVQVMGGTASEDGKRWDAPAKKIFLEDSVTIKSADGTEVAIKKVKLIAYPRGKFGYSDVFKIHCKMTVLAPEDGSAPYSMGDAESELVG